MPRAHSPPRSRCGLLLVAVLVLAACSAGGGASPTTVPAETTPAVDVPATDAPTTTSPAEELPALDDVTAPAWKPTTRTEELEVTIPLIDLRLVSFNVDKADMDTLGPTQSDDPTRGIVCRIRVFPLLWKAQNDDETPKTAFAHELFHCFQGWWNPIGGFPAWLTEGSASFAAFDLYRSSFDPPARYNTDKWFTQQSAPLSARSYSAWPLFESFLQYGGDPYAAVKAMYVAAGEGGATRPADVAGWLKAGGLDEVVFRARWSSNALRSTAFSEDEWSMKWPHTPGTGPHDQSASAGVRGVGTYRVHGSEGFA